MTTTGHVDRRRFLYWTACGLGLLAGERRSLRHASSQRRPITHAAVVRLFDHLESARVIGRTYLQRYPHEASVLELETRLAHSLNDRPIGHHAGRAALAGMLAETIRKDFAADRIVTLHGWVLSRTEARLCALAALA
jgi:hypothetical protein